MTEPTDAQLIERSQREPAAFEELFARHFAAIHRFLRRRVGAELAGELASETFLVAFRERSTFDPAHRSALPWLYGIAGNLVRRHHRAEQRRLRAYARQAGREHADDRAGAEVDGVDARLDATALAPRLAAALAELSDGLREVLLLHAWAQLSHDEIAQALECSPGAVRVRLSRARAAVGRALHEEMIER